MDMVLRSPVRLGRRLVLVVLPILAGILPAGCHSQPKVILTGESVPVSVSVVSDQNNIITYEVERDLDGYESTFAISYEFSDAAIGSATTPFVKGNDFVEPNQPPSILFKAPQGQVREKTKQFMVTLKSGRPTDINLLVTVYNERVTGRPNGQTCKKAIPK